jgi:hypothetical protein
LRYHIPSGYRIILVNLDRWFRTSNQTLLTARQLTKFFHTPPTRWHRLTLALKRRDFESNTSPLRINKRIRTSPPVGTSQILPYSLPPPSSSTLVSSSSGFPRTSSQRVIATQRQLTPSHHPHLPRATNVHHLMLKLGLAFLYGKISPMGWIPRTKKKTKKKTSAGGSSIRDGA